MSNPAYPTTPKAGIGSRRTLRDGRQEDVGSDGVVRVRKLYSDKWDFQLVYPALASADVTTIENFYASYGTAAAIDLVWAEDGQTYVVRFGRNAIERRYVAPGLRELTVRLVGV